MNRKLGGEKKVSEAQFRASLKQIEASLKQIEASRAVPRITKPEFLALVAQWGELQGSSRVMTEAAWTEELNRWIVNRVK